MSMQNDPREDSQVPGAPIPETVETASNSSAEVAPAGVAAAGASAAGAEGQSQHTGAAPQPHSQKNEPKAKGLPAFLKISIILLAALSIASISLLFIGDFEGKFERIFSTFFAFAIFVGLTAFDTRRGQRNEWYAPVALIANSYILALLLIVVWMSPAGWSLGWDIFWKSLVVIIVTRAVVGCSQLLLNMGEGRPRPLGIFALITSLLATVSGILFTAPVAIEVFNIHVPELYWKFAVASLLLTALGLAITLLLRWAYTGADREAARREREAARAAQAAHPYQPQGFPVTPAGVGQPVAPSAPYSVAQQAPVQSTFAQGMPGQAVSGQGVPSQQVGAQPLLPWPTFPDGRPLPAGPDGQPDFSVLNR